MHDMRDKTDCPSFTNLKKRETVDLVKLLVKCLEGQIEVLKKVENYDENLEK
jgi:hypothetical protein